MDNKICRFCLLEEKNGSDDVIRCFDDTTDFFMDKFSDSLGLNIFSEDVIPRLICKNCIDIIKKIVNFLETTQKAELVLKESYEARSKKLIVVNENKSEKNLRMEPTIDQVTTVDRSTNQTNKTVEEFQLNPYDLISSHSDSSIDNEINHAPIKMHKESSLPDLGKEQSISFFCEVDKVKIFQNEDDTYYCNICSKEFVTFCDYENHQQLHNAEYASCLKCIKVFPNKDKLVEHEKTHKVTCGLCNIQVLPSSLEAHMNKHSDIHKCISCDARHTSKAAMEKHFKARHAGIKGNVCHICGKQNSCQSSMKRHLASHFSNRPFKCKFCTFSAKSRTVLKVHVSRKHSNQQCDCEICFKKFKSVLSLKQHIKRMHNPKNYQCKICEKVFSEKFNLDLHILKKHSKQRLYECKICHTEFFTVKQLKDHMHSHRQGCVSCSKCDKEFFYKKYLDKHLLKCFAND